jgi:hypothetical protein
MANYCEKHNKTDKYTVGQNADLPNGKWMVYIVTVWFQRVRSKIVHYQ